MNDNFFENNGIIFGGLAFLLGINDVQSIIQLIIMIIGAVSALISLAAKIYRHFKNADTNGDGKLSIKEIIAAVKTLNVKEDAKQAKEQLKELENVVKDKEKEQDNVN